MKPLNKREFVTALKKGQGRAFFQIKQYGLEKYKDEVLTACLENQNYDTQVDFGRAPWLYKMYKDTPFYDDFQKAIIKKSWEPIGWENKTLQLCDLLGEMARDGDLKA